MSDALSLTHVEVLARVQLFSHLDRITLARLAAYLEAEIVEPGAVVCYQGEAGDSLYIVVRGTFGVFVSAESDLGETRVRTL